MVDQARHGPWRRPRSGRAWALGAGISALLQFPALVLLTWLFGLVAEPPVGLVVGIGTANAIMAPFQPPSGMRRGTARLVMLSVLTVVAVGLVAVLASGDEVYRWFAAAALLEMLLLVLLWPRISALLREVDHRA